MLHSPKEIVQPGHAPLRPAGAKLALNPYRLIADILKLGVVEQSLVVWRDGGCKPLERVLERDAGLGGRGRRHCTEVGPCARHRGAMNSRAGGRGFDHNTLATL